MDATLAGLKWKNLVVNMDYIIIFSSIFEEHIIDLEEVFERLEKANITLNQNKDNKETIIEPRKYPGIEVNYDLSNLELEELNALQLYKLVGIENRRIQIITTIRYRYSKFNFKRSCKFHEI